MHPLSPHAARTKPSYTGRFGGATASRKVAPGKGRAAAQPDALDALASEINGKLVAGSSAAKAHVAAEELTLRRPRRPAARRASFRTPPASR